MIKPFLFLTCITIALVLTCNTTNHVIHMSASGRPTDHLGDRVKCLRCGAGGVLAGKGYWYHCPSCDADYRARWLDEEKRVEVW